MLGFPQCSGKKTPGRAGTVGSSALALDWLSSRANNATLGGKCIASKPSNMHISGRVQTGYMQHHPLIGEYTLERNELKRLRKSANFALFVSMCRQVVRLASRAAFSCPTLPNPYCV
jgi:hypothetical protein